MRNECYPNLHYLKSLEVLIRLRHRWTPTIQWVNWRRKWPRLIEVQKFG